MILTNNQNKSYQKLSLNKVGALFMEPGEGKTLPAYNLVKSVPDIDYLLWLAPYQSVFPAKGLNGTKYELDKYGGIDITYDVYGIESLSSSDRLYLELTEKLSKAKNPFIVCDESLKIKNWDAIRTKRIIELSKLSNYKLILNGIPISRNLLDLWSQLEFLSPKILKMNMAEYKNTFCEYTKMTKYVGSNVIRREWINKYHNIDYLQSIIAPYVYECDLSIELQKQYIAIDYTLSEECKDEYNRLKEKYLDAEFLMAKNNNIFIEMTQKMQHVYNCTEDKFDMVDAILKENDPGKIVIFCKFIDSQEECKRRFPGVAVLSFQKHSFSLNIQDKYDTIIEFDQTWDFGAKKQASHRINRRGQQSKLLRYFQLFGNVGLETMMRDNIAKKVSMIDYFKSKSIEELKKEL